MPAPPYSRTRQQPAHPEHTVQKASPSPDSEDREDRASRPRSRHWGLAALFNAVLLVGLVASHLIVMAVLQHQGQIVHPSSRQQALHTLAAAYTAALQVPTANQAALWQAWSSPATPLAEGPVAVPQRMGVANTPALQAFAMEPEERAFATSLQQQLALTPTQEVRIQIERVSGSSARASLFSPAAWQPLQLRASIALPPGSDAQWLNASMALQGRYEWQSLLWFTLLVSVLPIMFFGYWLTRHLVTPLRDLVQATARVRFGSQPQWVPIRGPKEARELTQQFNAMQQRLAAFQDERTEILASISHDLRTPVTAMRLQVELIDDIELKDTMTESVEDLQHLVEETLDYVRADRGSESLTRCDVHALVERVVQRYQRLGHAVVQTTADAPLIWSCRPLALQRAVANLVENAVRYGGQEEVLVRLQESALMLRIEVLDRGPGIPDAKLERMMEPFTQGDIARGPERQGLGLGLAIARACVQGQDGELRLFNLPGGGLVASIALHKPELG